MHISSKARARLMAGPYTRLLAEHEEAIGLLYVRLGEVFPESAAFWNELAKEEIEHKKLILEIHEKCLAGKWTFQRPSFVTEAILQSLDWIASRKENIETRGISMRNALKLAVQIEDSMMESRFFEIIENDSPEMVDTLESLAAYTRAHAQRLRREARRLKWKIMGGRMRVPKGPVKAAILSPEEVRARTKAAQADMLGLLVSVEETMSRLYNSYSRRLPAMREFWARKAAEEMSHAAMLRKLYDILGKGKIFYNVERFNKRDIEVHIDETLNAEFDARNSPLSLHDAVQTALHLERTLIENGFYSIVKSDAPEFAYIADSLTKHTRKHIQQISEQAERIAAMGTQGIQNVPPPPSGE